LIENGLTVYQTHAQIIPYAYEDASNALNARGGAINITRWFDDPPIPRMLHATFISGSEELLLVDETGLARIFSLVTEQFRFVLRLFCECNTDWIRIALLFASWTTFPLRFILYQMVPRSSHWNQEARNDRAFSAITLPRLILQLQFLLNYQRRYTSVPIWRFLAWKRQRTLTQYS